MTYLVITDNLIDNLDDLEINELKYEKIKSDEINNSTSVSLFSDDSYKSVTMPGAILISTLFDI